MESIYIEIRERECTGMGADGDVGERARDVRERVQVRGDSG